MQSGIGIINDIHHDGGIESLNSLYEAVAALKKSDAELLIVAGDLIDSISASNAERLLREVSAICSAFQGSVRYMPGNHDLDFISKAQFYDALGCAGETLPCRLEVAGTKILCLDGNFLPDGTEYDAGNFEWQQSFIPEKQLDWLRNQLETAKGQVLIVSHQRLDSDDDYSVQNGEAVRQVIDAAGKAAAVFQGHQHADDLRKIGKAVYYTLAAHRDDAGPALIQISESGIRLARDYRKPGEGSVPAVKPEA